MSEADPRLQPLREHPVFALADDLATYVGSIGISYSGPSF